MHVIGTAGHVDHGKSTLVQALTGIHPDRLKEEREREMTIDLGFAWMVLPSSGDGTNSSESQPGEEVGIIDVPGHRDFIENMLAGVGGIDAALFVVAADEGVMPQTREHLAILDLLEVQGGVIALTKIDLVNDPDWLDLVESDLRGVLRGTVLEDAHVVRVSSLSKAGLPELKKALSENLSARPPRPDLNRPRLPVDRVFTIAGFGTVATGTLIDGSLKVGDDIEILPGSERGRIRGLQTHRQKEAVAVPGSRTAVNISGVALDKIQRGDVITHPGDYQPTRRLDASFRLLPDASQPLRHNTQVKLFIGSSEVISRLRLLGVEQLDPGDQGWLQLETAHPVVATRGDHYILRRPSPGETLGGGQVVDPHPEARSRRFSREAIARLEALSKGAPEDILLQALAVMGVASFKEVISRSNMSTEFVVPILNELIIAGRVLKLDGDPLAQNTSLQADDLLIRSVDWERMGDRVTQVIAAYHHTHPLRPGLPREELKSRLKEPFGSSPRLFNAALRRLVSAGRLKESGPLISLPDHAIRFTSSLEAQVERLLSRFAASPYAPPTLKESESAVGEEIVAALVDLGRLVLVPPDLLFREEDYQRMLAELEGLFEKHGALTVAQVRDHFNTSRKYILTWLEFLDSQGVTVREGDARRLKG